MMRSILVLLLGFVVAFPMSSAFARSEGIAVVVNEGLISSSDVQNRMKLIIESSGLPNTEETQARLMPQIVRSLVEEELQLQEADRLAIEVSSEEVQKAFSDIAQSNKLTAEQFRTMMEQRNVPIDSLYRQLKAQTAWRKVFAASMAEQIRISDADVEAYMQRLLAQAGRKEYLLSEIFLPVEEAAQEGDAKQLAHKVVSDLRAKRAEFGAVAQQISRAPGAAQGGLMGWVQVDQLDANIANALRGMEAKTISDPVRSLAGYHILYLINSRVITKESVPAAEKVQELIFSERAERLARGRMVELRNTAFIEYRL